MIKKLTASQIHVISQNNGMKLYLDNLVQGKDATKRSWLYEDQDADTVLQNWMNHLETLEHGSEFEKKVFQFDTSQLEKWGPQGKVAPIADLMQEIVLPTYADADSPQPKAFTTTEWNRAKLESTSSLKKLVTGKLRPASYKRVVDDMRARDVLESNSGWPDFKRRNLQSVKSNAIAAAQDGQWKTYPAIALFRNYNQKTRLVWMFPMAANLVEGSFFQPLQSSLMRKEAAFFSPWIGFNTVRKQITEAYNSGKYLYASDFSATDAHFQLPSSMQVIDTVGAMFDKSIVPAIEESIYNMHTIPLIVGPDQKLVGKHGVSSGSNWTNFIETIFDLQLSKYVSILTENQFTGLYAIGDDMCWISNKFSDAFEDELKSIGKDVGQDINSGKTTADPDAVKTLQRLFQRGYSRPDGLLRGVYSTIRALKSSIYPEKFHKPKLWSSDMFCVRQYMILENCVDHPLFEEFVSFVVHGQKDLIPFAKRSSSDQNRALRKSKLLPGLNPTYNQERRDGKLSDFKSIEIARSL